MSRCTSNTAQRGPSTRGWRRDSTSGPVLKIGTGRSLGSMDIASRRVSGCCVIIK